MEPWLEAVTKFGLPVVGAAVIAWFLGTKVWPWMVLQVEKTQAAREKDLDRFSDQIVKRAEEQTQAIRAISEDIRSRWPRER